MELLNEYIRMLVYLRMLKTEPAPRPKVPAVNLNELKVQRKATKEATNELR